MHRLKHLVRWEFLALFLMTVLVFNFAYEPNQRALIESLFEKHYSDLQQFYQVYQAVETKPKLSRADVQYAERVLSNLIEKGFILKPEAYHTLGKLYEREKRPTFALSAYESMLSLSITEGFLKREAYLGIARVRQAQRRFTQAKEALEKAWAIPTTYREQETAFALLDIYSQIGEKNKQKAVLLKLNDVFPSYLSLYHTVLRRLWDEFSPSEQLSLLERWFVPSMVDLLAEQGKRYIAKANPPLEWVEKWAVFLASYMENERLRGIEIFLKQRGYGSVAEELSAYRVMNLVSLPTGSSSAQAAYAYKALRAVSRRANYKPSLAEKYYENFLARGFHSEYVSKNLELLIRNLLAYKQYDRVVFWVEKTYEKMGVSETSFALAENISFWYGYSAWRMGNLEVALREWGRTVATAPGGYFGSLAVSYLREVVPSELLEEYIRTLKKKREESKYPSDILFFNRLLYGLAEKGMEKEKYKKEVVTGLSQLYPDLFGSSLAALDKLPMEKYFRWLVYSRFGFTEYARELLYETGIKNEIVADLAVLKVLVYYKNFARARELFSRIENDPLIKPHVVFLPSEFQKVLYPLPYTQEVRLALAMQTNDLCDVYLVHAVIKGESLFYPRAISRVGARGLMQLMPATARLLIPSVFDETMVSLYDPANNIVLGTKFLANSLQTYGLVGALAVYNGGQRVVERTRNLFQPDDEVVLAEILPYTETRLYVRKILGYYQGYLATYENRQLPLSLVTTPRFLTKK
ncbi:MAG: lytic transglycosylase domain-containing protein [Brevinematales bacterium]|nr:lytic transglycosylase domain-containing protein [Brevinematales bacterium]